MYVAYVTTLKNIKPHSNANRLLLAECFGNQVIVGLDCKEGDIGLYFPTDGQLDYDFALNNNLLRLKDENGNYYGGYLDPNKRNIRAMNLRQEKSDGLFIPLDKVVLDGKENLKVGDSFSSFNGKEICKKYVPITKSYTVAVNSGKAKIKPKYQFPFFKEHVDTSQLKYSLNSFKEGDICIISLKTHGTSSRIALALCVEKKSNWFTRLFRVKAKERKFWSTVSGSRRVVLDYANKQRAKDGFYSSDFREYWHDFISPKLDKGITIYGEIVGYENGEKLIMASCNNKLLQDKEFVKQYGTTTKFTYGCPVGTNDFYVYRITKTDEDGNVIELPTWTAKNMAEKIGLKFVPIFEQFIFTTKEDLLERVNRYSEGADPIDNSHIREGVVVRIENRDSFTAFKEKNYQFKVLEGIIKDTATEPDMEEAQDI